METPTETFAREIRKVVAVYYGQMLSRAIKRGLQAKKLSTRRKLSVNKSKV